MEPKQKEKAGENPFTRWQIMHDMSLKSRVAAERLKRTLPSYDMRLGSIPLIFSIWQSNEEKWLEAAQLRDEPRDPLEKRVSAFEREVPKLRAQVNGLLSFYQKQASDADEGVYQASQNMVQNLLGQLHYSLLELNSPDNGFSENALRRVIINDIQKRRNTFAGVCQEARKSQRAVTWGELLEAAAQKDTVIRLGEDEIKRQGGGMISDIHKIKRDGQTQFFKKEQVIKNDSEIEHETIDKMPDGPFKQALMRRNVELEAIQGKKERIATMQSARQPTEETLTEEESSAPAPWTFGYALYCSLRGAHLFRHVGNYISPDTRKKMHEVMRTETIPAYFGKAFVGNVDTALCDECMTYIDLAASDFIVRSKLCNDMDFKKGANVTNRNIATNRLADLLGVGNLFARSEAAQLQVGDAAPVKGIVMEGAEGANYDLRKEKGQKFKGATPEFVRQLHCLEVLDQLMIQTDRHINNYFIQYDKKNRAVGVTGIDNDNAFDPKHHDVSTADKDKGLYVDNKLLTFGKDKRDKQEESNPEDKERTRRRMDYLRKRGWNITEDIGEKLSSPQAQRVGTSPVIDKRLAQSILALTPDILDDALSDALEPEARKALNDRLIMMQQTIKNTQEDAQRRGQKYMLDPEDWNQKVYEELSHQKITKSIHLASFRYWYDAEKIK